MRAFYRVIRSGVFSDLYDFVRAEPIDEAEFSSYVEGMLRASADQLPEFANCDGFHLHRSEWLDSEVTLLGWLYLLSDSGHACPACCIKVSPSHLRLQVCHDYFEANEVLNLVRTIEGADWDLEVEFTL